LPSFDDILKRASLATDTVPLCLAGDLLEQLGQLERQLADAKPATSLEDTSPKRAIAERIVELQAEMREATVDFHLRAMPSRKWSIFYNERPERAEGESAEDWESRYFPWQAQLVSRTCVDPEMTVDQVVELADQLHFHAWAILSGRAYILNMGEVDVPNSDAASVLSQDSETT
jgi:hypothetical protein